jgi:hypothetical protein
VADAVEEFYGLVNARAEAAILAGEPITGAHHRSIEAEIARHRADRAAAPAARTERDVANDMVGMYVNTRKWAKALYREYTFEATNPGYDPLHDYHRERLLDLIRLCDEATDRLVIDYGG